MVIVIDTSALVAVLTSEPARDSIVSATMGTDLVAPGSVHWEVGNALSAMIKRKRATASQVQRALTAYAAVPIRLVDVDLALALEIAAEHGLYAYDAYVITCALGQRAPLLSLDRGLTHACKSAGVHVLEIPQ